MKNIYQQAELRRRWRKDYAANEAHIQAQLAQGIPPEQCIDLPLDPAFKQLRCGVVAHSTGAPCKQTVLFASGRCKYHGGMSTGPKSEAAKQLARINGKLGGRPRKPKS